MAGYTVKVEIHNDGFIPLCKDGSVQALLEAEAQKLASRARAATGSSSHGNKYRNDDFIVASKQLDRTAIARVSAANPRSDWYAKNKNVLN